MPKRVTQLKPLKTHHHCPTRKQIDSLVGKDHITPGIGQVHIHLSNLGDSNESIPLSSSRCLFQPGCYFVKVGISYKILQVTRNSESNLQYKLQTSGQFEVGFVAQAFCEWGRLRPPSPDGDTRINIKFIFGSEVSLFFFPNYNSRIFQVHFLYPDQRNRHLFLILILCPGRLLCRLKLGSRHVDHQEVTTLLVVPRPNSLCPASPPTKEKHLTERKTPIGEGTGMEMKIQLKQ